MTSVFFLLMLACTAAWSRDAAPRRDSLKIDVSIEGSMGTNASLKPMWSYSQQWGRYTQYNRSEALAYAKFQYGWTNRKGWFNIKGGVSGQYSTDGLRRMLHEAYISGRIWKIDYTVGREARTPINQHDNLGLGTFIMSSNARPTTRAGLGFFDYWAIPGLRNWIEIKGGLYLGEMPYAGSANYTKGAILHEKFAYLRIGHFPVKPYVGIVHSAMMGGTLADGTQLPIDFWATFFARGSEKFRDAGPNLEGEYYNACGGHSGLWDVGVDFDFDDFGASLYYQRPFYDCQGLYLEDFGKCRDFQLGLDLELKKCRGVRRLNFEYLTTVWQGGLGNSDPAFRSTGPVKTGEVCNIPILKFTPELVHDYFSAEIINEWEAEHGPLTSGDLNDFLIKYANHGKPWGNRCQYLMNGVYPQGWTVDGLSMGYPIFMTDRTMQAIAPGYNFTTRFPNICMMALNFGIEGDIIPALSYRAKVTYTNNYGSTIEKYWYDVDKGEFIEYDNYYFSKGRTEVYTGLWLDYRLKLFTFSVSGTWDFGQMYNSLSLRFGVKFALDCIPFKK